MTTASMNKEPQNLIHSILEFKVRLSDFFLRLKLNTSHSLNTYFPLSIIITFQCKAELKRFTLIQSLLYRLQYKKSASIVRQAILTSFQTSRQRLHCLASWRQESQSLRDRHPCLCQGHWRQTMVELSEDR